MNAYQQSVEWLTENLTRIREAWEEPDKARGGCLFAYASRGRHSHWKDSEGQTVYGCLTEIRSDSNIYVCEIPELTVMIAADDRLPTSYEALCLCHLPTCAQWQQFLDFRLSRDPPPVDDRLPPPVGNIEIPPISELEDQWAKRQSMLNQ
jgi:hypothetical protein